MEPRSGEPVISEPALPDPAVVVLIGAAGSGKSTWAAAHYARAEIVSSDELRGIVGSGPADLDASVDAFALLDQIVAARTSRTLTTVIDTLGLDAARRRGYLTAARAARIPAVAVIMTTDEARCRQRNARRDRPVPAPVLANQLRSARTIAASLDAEGWDRVLRVDHSGPQLPEPAAAAASTDAIRDGLRVILQVSRFPWSEHPQRWLTDIARRADEVGFAGIALMDHLIQIPQVGRAWEPIPEPWVTLGLLAGLDTRLRLGTLISPVTFRAPGILAKTAATLDVLSAGRAFCGVGAGWWEREHAAYGLPFPPARQRLDQLEATIETLRALWSTGTKPYAGARATLPETTCYPRPVGQIPIIVGGSGERRTLKIAAAMADGCNLPSNLAVLDAKVSVLNRHCAEAGRDPQEVQITVLDIPVIGTDRGDVARRVERLRGRTRAATFAAGHHAGTVHDHVVRYHTLAEHGVRTVFLSLPDLSEADDLDRCAPLVSSS